MFAEDLTAFIHEGTPGYAVATVAGVDVDALIDNGFTLSTMGIEGADAAITCISADVAGASHGTTVVVNAISYRVCGIEPDGFGLTMLRLEKP